jgi:hypothetical protein
MGFYGGLGLGGFFFSPIAYEMFWRNTLCIINNIHVSFLFIYLKQKIESRVFFCY